jgi:LacI family transcriptional regulator
VDGFAAVFAGAGQAIPPERVSLGDFTVACGVDAVHVALAAGVEFDSVFAHNDLSALGAMQALLDSGRRTPQDVAVVGFDDIPTAAHTQPPLSTVHQPLREMGEAAARTLLAHFEGTPLPARPTVIPTTFVTRGSTVA